MRSITWASAAATTSSTLPTGGVSARELDALVEAWIAAPNKGDFLCSLPLHQAQALCAVARERLPQPEPKRGKPCTVIASPMPAIAQSKAQYVQSQLFDLGV